MTGADLIALERTKQIKVEGYDSKHDLSLDDEALEMASIAYILSSVGKRKESMKYWPWLLPYIKPKTKVRDLVRAGALIAAAIDRIQSQSDNKSNVDEGK